MWLKDLISDTFGATVGITLRDFIGSLGKKGHEMAMKKIEDLIKDNPRADLLYVLLAMDPADAAKLWQRHLSAIKSGIAGAENDFTRILGQALPRDAQGQIDMERAKVVFTQIAKMDETRFCQIMEELNHDPVSQHIRHWLRHGAGLAESLLHGIVFSASVTARKCEQINQGVTQLAERINRETQDRRTATFFGGLISRIP